MVVFLDLIVLMDATTIAKISSVSFLILSNLVLFIKLLSSIISSQKIVSSASSSTIFNLLIKSSFDLARHAAL